MKQLLFALLLLPSICSAQLVFEVNSPTTERGVFPCMAGKNSEWVNSPDLYQNGNWYSDTVFLADDGTLGSACSPLNNSIVSNFVLFHRTGCSLGESLLNAQNAGATGAIVIDSVDGRPLPFLPDGLSASITIPFVIISEAKGDSLIQRILDNQDVIVSFGDKTGVNTTDVGIYKEFSLWSRYGIFPLGSYELPDDHFGTWVYNHGTTGVDSLQIRLWFYHDPSYPLNNQEVLSPHFNLTAGDSVFVDFNFEYIQSNNANAIFELNPLEYGYELIGLVDDDSLDNAVSSVLYADDELISNTFTGNLTNWNADLSYVDYLEEGTSAGYDSIGYCLYMPIKLDNGSNAYFCNPTIVLANGDLGSEIAITQIDVNISNQQASIGNYYNQGFYYVEDSTDTAYIDFEEFGLSFGWNSFDQSTDLVLVIQTSGSTSLGFTSDMYHDERIRQGELPTYFKKVMTNSGGDYVPQFILTPILSLNMSIFSYCYWNSVDEIENAKITLYPNPAEDVLTISSSESIRSISLYDMLGKKIKEFDGESQLEKSLSVASLKSGCYLIEVTNENGERNARRFVKD